MVFNYNYYFVILFICGSCGIINAVYQNNPKIITQEGHLRFDSGQDRNISFRLRGSGRLNIGNIDVLTLVEQIGQIANTDSGNEAVNEETLDGLRAAVRNLKLQIYGTGGIERRLQAVENGTLNTYQQRIRNAFQKLRRLDNSVTQLYTKLQENNCRSNPCQNGGTCIDLYDSFMCKCPKNWEGPTCSTDVNECAQFAGTELGCQNGAACINTPGSYSCQCSAGWVGIHCTRTSVDCLQSSSTEMCGHGVCVNTNVEPRYTCICEQGWKTNGLTPACTVDIDECTEKKPPCESGCVNLPGSFMCAPCPAGLTGNGYYCRDIDECAVNNGGCSTNPSVACINTHGSYRCGECPINWYGDGRTCTRSDESNMCTSNNICHPLATCQEVSNTVICTCPAGMTGLGVGPNGCSALSTDPCLPNPCKNNGTCAASGQSFTCICPRGFVGRDCRTRVASCDPNPCENGGTCVRTRNSYRCICTAEYRGRNCHSPKQSCSSVLTDESGVLKYPLRSSYNHNARCVWLIKTNETKVLNVTFRTFDLEHSNDCSYDWLQIHDGESSSAQLIGRFCGHSLPKGGNIITSANALYLWFRSDNSTTRSGFELEWSTIDPVCGGQITVSSHGTLASPGSPGNYPPNRDCTWSLMGPYGKRIQIIFFVIKIEAHSTCDYDHLAIYEGGNTQGTLLGKYCNTTQPPPLITPGNEATLHFHSDDDGTDLGFQIHYSVIPGTPGCGGIHTTTSGEFSAPMEGDVYKQDIVCEYLIQLPLDSKISIKFTKFHLEESSSCSFDYLEIYEGKNEGGTLVGKWCGQQKPQDYTSRSNMLFFKFKADSSNTYAGFTVTYNIACGGEFGENNGVVTSPMYPNEYMADRVCEYHINAPLGNAIELQFSDFELEDKTSSNECRFDYLEVFDGFAETPITTLCGDRKPATIISTLNLLRLRLTTDSTNHKRGFKANYTFIGTGCGGILKEETGLIKSKSSSPMSTTYEHNARCTWVIAAPTGYIINLQWLNFALEESSGCQYDYVEVFDNGTATQNKIGRFCGNQMPPSMVSSKNLMTITFATDSSQAYGGFKAAYFTVDGRSLCGGRYFSSTGVISSPGWPDKYEVSKECVWIISVEAGKQIELNVRNFTLEGTDGCKFDYLEIRNGGTPDAPIIGRYCGTVIPSRIPSLGNQMHVKFVSDNSLNYEGFYIEWDSASGGCGGIVSSGRGTISSPNYPHPYPHNAQCNWRISMSQGSGIRIIITELQMEANQNCAYDYLEIYDGSTPLSPKLGRWCSTTNYPLVLTTRKSQALVRMVTDSSSAGRGFQILYSMECNMELTDFRGVIQSPNFPEDYPDDIRCEWTIKAPRGNKVAISFSHFDLERSYISDGDNGGSCSYDWVEITDENATTNKTKKYCNTKPLDMTSADNILRIVFRTDGSNRQSGFHMEYEMVGCGGHLKGYSGEITSPGYPNDHPHDVECIWLLEVDIGSTIQLSVLDMDIEATSNCTFDGLLVANGRNESNLLTIFCGRNGSQPLNITGGSHQLFLKFYSDYSFTGKGFRALYQAVPASCGGKLTTTNGYIYSENYPNNYKSNSACEWLIELENQNSINVTLVDLDTERNDDCSRDYLQIFEGTQATAEARLYRGCGNELPAINSWLSKGNQLLITFHTDYDTEYKGFKLRYEEACGRRINITEPGLITRSNAQSCQWTLIAPRLDEKITLTITLLDFWDQSIARECRKTMGLWVYEGDSTDGPVRASYCGEPTLPIVSNGNMLTVVLNSPGVNHFEAYYSTLDNACGGTITSFHAKLASPMYPDTYPVNTQCIWILEAPRGMHIEFNVAEMDIEESPHCNQDYLEIRKGNGSGEIIGIFCGNQPPNNLRIFERAWIKFSSDNNVVGKGFLAEHTISLHNELSGSGGKINSPGYPRANTRSETFTWRITGERGYVIQVLLEAEIDHYGAEYFLMYDGFDESGASIPFSEEETVYTTTTSVMFISVQLIRLSLRWRAVPKSEIYTPKNACQDQTIPVAWVPLNLTSPGYPKGYEDNMNCSWIIRPVDSGTRAALLINDISMDDEYECYGDYIRVSQSTDMADWKAGEKICKKGDSMVMRFYGTPYLKLDFITDSYRNGSGFNSTVRVGCGGSFTDPVGVINGTLYGSMFMNENCNWTVHVPRGKKIQFEFESLQLSKGVSGQCASYVLIKNGIDEDSPILGSGRYCGSNPNEVGTIPLTTGNRAYVEFVYEPRSALKMVLKYKAVSPECGEDLILTENDNTTTITSPNYPNIPHPHIECIWTIRGPMGHKLQLTFVDDFHVGNSPDCTNEYVEVNDGGTKLAPQIGKYCYTKPNTILSSDLMLRVKYFTDVPEPGNGFKAIVQLGVCGGRFHATNGTITSPHYPVLGGYPRKTTCDYYIEQPAGSTINITFEDMHLPSGDCDANDNVKVYSVVKMRDVIEETLITSACGTYTPQRITSGSNIVLIRFTSFEAEAIYRGFKISYATNKAECGGDIEAESGTLTSLGYPNGWARRQSCIWRITVPKGRRVKLYLEDVDALNVVVPNNRSRRRETKALRLYIYNDHGYLSPISFNTSQPPAELSSSDNEMRIVAFLDSLSGHRGMKFRFTSLEPTICPGNLNSPSGTIVPPTGNLSSYFCSYEASLASGTTLSLTHSEVNVQTSIPVERCRTGSISVDINKEKVYNVCQNMSSNTIRIAQRNAHLVVFQSTYRRIGDYRIDYRKHPCGGLVDFTDNLTLSLPTLPENYGKLDCAWQVSKGAEDNIHINITGLLNMKLDCDKEFLKLLNGPTLNKPQLERLCGANPLPKLVAFNDLYVEYHTDTYRPDSGFSLTLNSIDECGGLIEAPFRQIHFNTAYKDNVECIWTILTSFGFHIGAEFIDRFYIEQSDGCRKDYLAIRDKVNGEWVEIGRVCGRDVKRYFNSTGNEMQLIFRSDGNVVGDGFSVQFSNNCGGIYQIEESRRREIVSPNYPDLYPSSIRCNYTFIAPEQEARRLIHIKFDDFDIEGYSRCYYDNFTIYEYENYAGEYKKEKTYCGTQSPGEIRKYGRVSMIFETDDRYSRKGFKFSYGYEECGGLITNETTIKTPAILDKDIYPPDTECIWNITAPSEKNIVIRFEYIEFEGFERCSFDFVEVFSGERMVDANRRAKLCGRFVTQPTVVTVQDNKAIVHTKTDSSNQFRGFSANIFFKRKCDKRIVLSSAHPSEDYIDFGTGYDINLDCHIAVVADDGYQIKIHFNRFHLATCSNATGDVGCQCDFLEIYDGAGPFAELLGRYCGFVKPEDILTTGHRAYLRFVTDSVGSSAGIPMVFTQVPTTCGREEYTLDGSDVVTIESPGSPEYRPNLRCVWRIKTQFRNTHIHFLKMDIEDPTEKGFCVKDYVDIRNENAEDVGEQGFGPDFVHFKKTDADISRYDIGNAYLQRYRFCGSSLPSDFYTSANVIVIKFRSDEAIQKSGFKLEIQKATGCHKNYTAINGRIHGSQMDPECEIFINVPENYTITLYTDSSYEGHTDDPCEGQKTEVLNSKTNALIRRLCGPISPEDSIYSNTNQMRILIKTTNYFSIDLTYVATRNGPGCGGDLYNFAGLITSPMYPVNDRNFSDCRWNIQVPRGTHVGLAFSVFDMGSKITCDSDYLEVLEIENNADRVARRYCGDDKPEPYKGDNHYLSIRFRKTVNYDGTGWVIRFFAAHPDSDISKVKD